MVVESPRPEELGTQSFEIGNDSTFGRQRDMETVPLVYFSRT